MNIEINKEEFERLFNKEFLLDRIHIAVKNISRSHVELEFYIGCAKEDKAYKFTETPLMRNKDSATIIFSEKIKSWIVDD